MVGGICVWPSSGCVLYIIQVTGGHCDTYARRQRKVMHNGIERRRVPRRSIHTYEPRVGAADVYCSYLTIQQTHTHTTVGPSERDAGM